MSKSRKPFAPIENNLLGALSSKSYSRLAPYLEPVEFFVWDVLYRPNQPIEYAYFPHKSVISLVHILKDRSEVELALIGTEGMLGYALPLGDDISTYQAIVQNAGKGVRMNARVFKREVKRGGELHDLVLRYSQVLLSQVAQTAVCNTLHPLAERFARWVLQTQDVMQSDTVELTHELIARMLSVHRSGVTIAAGALQSAGIIKYSRGKLTILERQRLEEVSCECYKTIKAEYRRLIGKIKNN